MTDIDNMINEQIIARGIASRNVIDTMRAIPRVKFVPDSLKDRAYDDCPLPIGYGQTISQPFIVAYMLELLDLDNSHNVLEVGVGSGYQIALLAKLAKRVIGIELIPELADIARKRCVELEIKNLKIFNSDGYMGYPESAPYDRIIVAAAAPYIPDELINQLAPCGKMIIPIGKQMQNQKIKIITKDIKSSVHSQDSLDVKFVPLVKSKEK